MLYVWHWPLIVNVHRVVHRTVPNCEPTIHLPWHLWLRTFFLSKSNDLCCHFSLSCTHGLQHDGHNGKLVVLLDWHTCFQRGWDEIPNKHIVCISFDDDEYPTHFFFDHRGLRYTSLATHWRSRVDPTFEGICVERTKQQKKVIRMSTKNKQVVQPATQFLSS